MGTLFYLAQQAGWEPDSDAHQETEAERQAREQRAKGRAQEAAQQEARDRQQAATWTAALWKAGSELRADQGYFARKLPGAIPPATLREISAERAAAILGYSPKSSGEPLAGRLILAPVKIGNEITTAELIDETGRKAAIYGGAKAGGYWAAQPLPEDDGAELVLLIGEGVATTLTGKEATGPGSLAVAALSAGNLPKVARAMRERYPAARLVILADVGNGQAKAEEAAKATGAALAVPEFPAGMAGTDFNDLHQGAGLDAVQAQIRAALSIRQGAELPQSAQGRHAFRLVPVADLLRAPEPRRWLIPGYLLPDSLNLLFGPPACGKSLLSIAWAASIATGGEWCQRPALAGPVVYIAGEGHYGIGRRFMAWQLDQGEPLDSAPLLVSSSGAALIEAEALAAVLQEIDRINETHGKPRLIVVDTLHRNFGAGDENSAQDVGRFVEAMDVLRQATGAAVLIVHHSGHQESNRARGSSALRAAVDAEFSVSMDVKTVTLACTKAKDFEPPAPLCFELRQVSLPLLWVDGDGHRETSVVLAPTAYEPPPKSKPLPDPTRRALQWLVRAIHDEGTPPPPDLTLELQSAAPLRLVHVETWRDTAYRRAGLADTQEARKKAFGRARERLIEVGAIAEWGDFVWTIPERATPEARAIIEGTARQIEADKGIGGQGGQTGTNVPACPGDRGTDRDTHPKGVSLCPAPVPAGKSATLVKCLNCTHWRNRCDHGKAVSDPDFPRTCSQFAEITREAAA